MKGMEHPWDRNIFSERQLHQVCKYNGLNRLKN